jgi:hypothetical protein
MKSLAAEASPFQVGALYSRKNQIHALLGGQQQGGISTPSGKPYIILFTGEVGSTHGYVDEWDDEGLHYFGEGQSGDMKYTKGNLAISRHDIDGKRLLVFQMMGKGQPYRYLGEFHRIGQYEKEGVRDTSGALRKAIIFKLAPMDLAIVGDVPSGKAIAEPKPLLDLSSTVGKALVAVRKKQTLFRNRLISLEKGCRITGVMDLRFLRASHIKPWSACETGTERTDGNNGLLLSSQADHLFDQGWISFASNGELIRSDALPVEVIERVGLNLEPGRSCGAVRVEQQKYLEFHREKVLGQKFKSSQEPLDDLLKNLATEAPDS